MNFYLLIIIVSEYAITEFLAPSSQAGFAASIFIIGALIARLFSGKWLARVGYKKMLCIGIIANIIMTLAYFGINSIAMLLVVRFLHGAAFGISATSATTIVADIIPKERRGEGIGYFSLSQTLATAIGPFFGMFLSRHGSYNMIFAVCAITSVISLVIAPFLSLRKIELTEEQISSTKGFKPGNFIEYRAVPISIISLIIYLCYSSIVSFLTVYAKAINLVDAAGFFFIVYAVMVLITRPAGGILFDSKGASSVMYPAILLFAIGMFMFSRSYHGYVLLFSAALIGLGFGAIQSGTQTIAVKVTPQHRLGLANSTYFIFADIGMGIGPLLVGFIIPVLNYRGMYTLVSIVALSCIFLYYFLHSSNVRAGRVEG
nr:Major Facilitator [uncultured bacterium]